MKPTHQILIVVISFFLIIFQVSFLENLPFLRYFKPIFILLIILGIKGDNLPAVIVAFLGGIVEDAVSVFPSGLALFSNFLVLGALFYLRKKIFDFRISSGKFWGAVCLFFIYQGAYFLGALIFSVLSLGYSPIFSYKLIIDFMLGMLLNTGIVLIIDYYLNGDRVRKTKSFF